MLNSINSTRIGKMVRLAILIAILLLMAFTPLGYIRFGGLEITFLTVPVIIGAIILGPVEGAILGGVFGLTSFFQCFGMSPFGATLLSINPVLTFIVCFFPRTLMGLCCGLIFKGLSVIDKTKIVSFGAASLSGALLNTVFFMTSLVVCFYHTEYIQSIVQPPPLCCPLRGTPRPGGSRCLLPGRHSGQQSAAPFPPGKPLPCVK